MLEGRLAIKDLPERWRTRFQEDIGIQVPDDKDGALQDVHWFSGPVGGAFQGYTLGNILSAQFFGTAVKAKPSIPDEITRGEFGTLHGWLRDNVYRHGAKYTAAELIERVTGGPMSIEPYLEYLWKKYQPLYGLEESDLGATASR
jgi:carboxypeptidase Taq